MINASSVNDANVTNATANMIEQLTNHRHRNLKAFRELIQKMVSCCFIAERYL